jgi:DNA polymerase III epsilon subunit-like protein
MLIVDIEATGPDPLKNSIISIGGVNTQDPYNQFYEECQMSEGAECDPDAMKFINLTKEDVTDPNKPTLQETLQRFFVWCDKAHDKVVGGHNITFDVTFLRVAADRYELPWKLGFRFVDLHTIGYYLFAKKNIALINTDGLSTLSLNQILYYVGLPKEPTPHIAINGAKFEAEAYIRLVEKRSLLDEFASYPIPETL